MVGFLAKTKNSDNYLYSPTTIQVFLGSGSENLSLLFIIEKEQAHTRECAPAAATVTTPRARTHSPLIAMANRENTCRARLFCCIHGKIRKFY